MSGTETSQPPRLRGQTRRALRQKGRQLPVCIRIGKNGLSEPVLEQIAVELTRNTWVKLRVLKTADITSTAQQLELALGTTTIAVTGRQLVLYRDSSHHDVAVDTVATSAPQE